MIEPLSEVIQRQSRPLQSQPTNVEPAVQSLSNIKAVLFDIYGTLLISASGDIGCDQREHRIRSIAQVGESMSLDIAGQSAKLVDDFESRVRELHLLAKQDGVGYPEVDFREVWASVLGDTLDPSDVPQFTLEFEMLVNPTWPMPQSREVLQQLQALRMIMGIVSNAQFFTPPLLEGLFETSLDELGFSQNLRYFSYEHQQAKPGTYLYELARQKLIDLGISQKEVLYVGNDMLNDVAAAAKVGFRTALFAGDARSLRWRSDDDRVHGVEADIVVTELPQLVYCLSSH